MIAHDIVTKDLEHRLRESNLYDLILTETPYKVRGECGECDIIALRGSYAVVFEIKGKDRPKSRNKAYNQIRRDYRWIKDRFPKVERIFGFYSHLRDKEVVLEWKINL